MASAAVIRRMLRGLAAVLLLAPAIATAPSALAAAAVPATTTQADPHAAHRGHHQAGAAAAVPLAIVTVEMTDNTFSPPALTVGVGTTVTWTNHGARFHTVTASSPRGAFDSGYVAVGASWSFTFTSAGTYVYHCEIHTGMAGTITVAGADVTPPPPSGPAVDISDNTFSPASLSIAPGTTVTWTNRGTVSHTVSASALFLSGRLAPGQTFSFTFAVAGAYSYVCDIHAGMAGSIVVGDGTPTPTQIPTPTPTAAPPGAGTTSVEITDDAFTPATLTVAPGATVTWVNRGARRHTVTRTGVFDSGLLSAGQTFSFTFTTPGTYAYVCELHAPGMAATIVVTGTAVATPTPTPTPTPTAAPAGSVSVTVGDDYFSPSTVRVTPGTTVTWTNRGSRSHTVTGVGTGSGALRPGESYSVRFDAAGGYSYACEFHPQMSGSVLVAAADAPAPTVAPTPVPTAPPRPSVLPGATVVDVDDNTFSPATLNITTGTKVTFANIGRVPHTVTASDGSFNAVVPKGSTFENVFHRPGTYAYVCSFHTGMRGVIVVTGAATAAASPTPTPTAAPAPTVASAPPPGSRTVTLADNRFDPPSLGIAAGTTVVWVNGGRLPHTVTSPAAPFDSGILGPGATFSVMFASAGRYEYLCELHEGMTGVIEVTGATAAGAPVAARTTTPTPTPSPTPSATAGATTAPRLAIAVEDNLFTPKNSEIAAGTSVTWTNVGKVKHTVTFTADGTTSELFGTGQSYSRTFEQPGTYDYLCALHPGMTGALRVMAAVATTAPSVPAAAAPVVATPVARAEQANTPEVGALRGDWVPGMVLGAVLAILAVAGIGGPLVLVFLQNARQSAQ